MLKYLFLICFFSSVLAEESIASFNSPEVQENLQIGRYQLVAVNHLGLELYLLDTATGQVWETAYIKNSGWFEDDLFWMPKIEAVDRNKF